MLLYCISALRECPLSNKIAWTEQTSCMSKKCEPTLPEGQEDDRLDGEEFEHRLVRPEQVTGCKEEEEESVESQADGEVVDDGDVKVSSIYAAQKHTNKQTNKQNEVQCFQPGFVRQHVLNCKPSYRVQDLLTPGVTGCLGTFSLALSILITLGGIRTGSRRRQTECFPPL